MSDASSIINNVRFNSAVATSSADVVVKGFSSGALQGILEAISKTNSVINELQSRLNDIQSDNNKRAQADEKKEKSKEKARVASLASERRSRATEAAILGEIQRGNTFNKMLRDGLTEALNGLTSFLKDNLNQSLKTQQSLAAAMRKANLSKDQKDQIQKTATAMKDIVNAKFDGLNVSNGQIADYIRDLIADGREVSRMSESELAGYIALRSRNTDSKEAYELSKTASEESIRTLTLDKGNYLIANSISKAISSLDANARVSLGGTDEALAKITAIVKKVEEYAGNSLDSDAVAELSSALLKGQNLNLLAQGDIPEELKRVIAAGGGPNVPIEELFENLKNIVNETTASVGAFPSYITAYAEASQNGRDTGKSSMSDDQIRKNNKENTPDGKLPNLFETIFNNTLGKITGPLSNTFDKWFGEDVDITKIVGTGFKIVIGLLGSIVASKMLKDPKAMFSSLLAKTGLPNMFGKIKGFFSKDKGGSKPLDGTDSSGVFGKIKGLFKKNPDSTNSTDSGGVFGKIKGLFKKNPEGTPKTPKTPRDLDKEYEEAIKKLNGLRDSLKNSAKEGFEKLKAVPGHIRDSSSKAFDKIKQSASVLKNSASNAFSSIKKSLINSPQTIKSTFSDIKKRGVIAMTKIPGMFKSMGGKISEAAGKVRANSGKIGATAGKIGKGLLGGLGIASGALSLLGATGAFDSLTPILNDFLNTLAPVLKQLVDTLAPTIQSLVTSLGPSIQEIVSSLAPILDHTLKALAPILVSLVKSLTPIFNSLLKSLMPVLDALFKTLAPVLGTLVKTLMPVIQTLFDVLTPILATILESLGPVIETMAAVWTPILAALGDILKGVVPALRILMKPMQKVLEWITKPLQLIAELMREENSTEDASEASTAAEKAQAAGDIETANKARAVQLAYAKGESKIERNENESDKAYFARAYKELYGDKANDVTSDNINDRILEEIKKGVKAQDEEFWSIGDNFGGKDIEYWRDLPDVSLIEELGKIFGFKSPYSDEQKKTLRTAISTLDPDRGEVKLANGGVFNHATNAIIGEDGREAVLPLTKQDQLLNVLNSLTLSESRMLLKSVLASKNFSADNLLTSFSKYVEPAQTIGGGLVNFIRKFTKVDQATAAQIESNSLAEEYTEAVKVVKSSSSDEAKQTAAQFSKTALKLLGDKSSSPEILDALSVMIKYLRDIASSPANKKVISSASRPVSMSY